MFIFGHIGLTIGLFSILVIIFKKVDYLPELDFRIIAVFAVLPDIFDKVIGHLLLSETLNNGRLFSHTLVFLALFIIIFALIVGSHWWIYSLPIITHQLFDTLWFDPHTWLWPMYGWSFEFKDVEIWEHWLTALLHNPYIIITEICGVIVLILVIIRFKLYKKKNFTRLLSTGRLNNEYLK
jgi:hypothetical protein